MADNTIDDAERDAIRRVLNESSDLATSEVDLVMELAQNQVRALNAAGSVKDLFTPEQAAHFIESLHAVAAADGEVSPEEIQEINDIAAELGFPAAPH